MRISLIDKFTNLTQRIAARSHAAKPLNQARFKRQQGATAIEYAIIAAVIALAVLAASSSIDIQGLFENFFTEVKDAIGSGGSGGSGTQD
ncbi:Flp family type IVb pilin [Chromohalobacter sp. TMW 2.2308]|uniref:Flp family type IVb pilin n=1 Tax=Chromohalobacter TaxID=42054 RepID=UPI001FFD6A52|nr:MULTISPECIES: Flp family type IVb pilin [Chromohalobacter]MCK2042143.1 Flp family type IVb pilin [Chromohalobacter moromii]MCT8514291.1 Flp family type IVb pilin [Chromohalobacter sp. TMW 2.2271]